MIAPTDVLEVHAQDGLGGIFVIQVLSYIAARSLGRPMLYRVRQPAP